MTRVQFPAGALSLCKRLKLTQSSRFHFVQAYIFWELNLLLNICKDVKPCLIFMRALSIINLNLQFPAGACNIQKYIKSFWLSLNKLIHYFLSLRELIYTVCYCHLQINYQLVPNILFLHLISI